MGKMTYLLFASFNDDDACAFIGAYSSLKKAGIAKERYTAYHAKALEAGDCPGCDDGWCMPYKDYLNKTTWGEIDPYIVPVEVDAYALTWDTERVGFYR